MNNKYIGAVNEIVVGELKEQLESGSKEPEVYNAYLIVLRDFMPLKDYNEFIKQIEA
jgi:hypothetical protein